MFLFDKSRFLIRTKKSMTLASTISYTVCCHYNLPVMLELDKTHPQDFGNPGRVRSINQREHNKNG